MAQRHGLEDKLSRRQRVGLIALLEAPTVNDAARDSGVPARSLWRWLARDDFAEAYRAASRQRLDKSVGKLRSVSERAVEVLQGLMDDETVPAAVRARCASTLLDVAVRVDTDSLRVRVEALEAGRTPPTP